MLGSTKSAFKPVLADTTTPSIAHAPQTPEVRSRDNTGSTISAPGENYPESPRSDSEASSETVHFGDTPKPVTPDNTLTLQILSTFQRTGARASPLSLHETAEGNASSVTHAGSEKTYVLSDYSNRAQASRSPTPILNVINSTASPEHPLSPGAAYDALVEKIHSDQYDELLTSLSATPTHTRTKPTPAHYSDDDTFSIC